jgi:phosphoserine phosphatase
MMTPPFDSAMSIARADLPLAVGPQTIVMVCVMSKSVLTLIAAPAKEKLTDECVSSVANALSKIGAQIIHTDWLAQKEACDIIFSRIEPEKASQVAERVLEGQAIDFIAQLTDGRQKHLLISDMDSTIITIECIDEIADFCGIKPQVAAITERAMRGEMEFSVALAERVLLLKGLQESILQQVYDERVKFMPGARELVATMRAHGAYAMLVSGGFDFFTSQVAQALGFHADSANKLAMENGELAGTVILPILDKNAKLQTLMQVCSERNISTKAVLAVGDGANDVPMLMAAGLGVAYYAKPVVQQSVGAKINHTDLRALLYAQGYRQEEIIIQ